MMSYITVAWYLINHSAPLRAVLSFRPVYAMLAFGAMAAKCRSILSFMDTFVARFPQAILGAIVLSGLAGSGGMLFVQLEKIVQDGLQTSSQFSNPAWSFKSAYIAAGVYYVATDPAGWIAEHVPFETITFPKDQVRFAISVALCTHAAFETLYGRHVNPMYPFEEILCAITGVRKPVLEDEAGHEEMSSSSKGSEFAGKKARERQERQSQGLRRRNKGKASTN